MNNDLPVVLGITGASGAIYGFSLLKFFLENGYKVDLVLSSNSEHVAYKEMGLKTYDVDFEDKAEIIFDFLMIEDESNKRLLKLWRNNNVAASISSGSYKTQGMIIAPCSMGTIGNIAAGTSNNLIARAADVTIKERRNLVLLARETPLNSIHLENMLKLSQCGVTVMPASPGFYNNPQTIQDQVNFVLGKALDQLKIDNELFKRWSGDSPSS